MLWVLWNLPSYQRGSFIVKSIMEGAYIPCSIPDLTWLVEKGIYHIDTADLRRVLQKFADRGFHPYTLQLLLAVRSVYPAEFTRDHWDSYLRDCIKGMRIRTEKLDLRHELYGEYIPAHFFAEDLAPACRLFDEEEMKHIHDIWKTQSNEGRQEIANELAREGFGQLLVYFFEEKPIPRCTASLFLENGHGEKCLSPLYATLYARFIIDAEDIERTWKYLQYLQEDEPDAGKKGSTVESAMKNLCFFLHQKGILKSTLKTALEKFTSSE